jgi:hypothetical protein
MPLNTMQERWIPCRVAAEQADPPAVLSRLALHSHVRHFKLQAG